MTTALRRYAWVAAVAAALILVPSGEAHSGADYEAAYADIDWEEIRRAAERGDAEAQIMLGSAYFADEDALGVSGEIPQDDVQAYVWLSLGVAGLSNAGTDELMIARDFAIDDLQRLEKRMTQLQLRTARRLIQERRGGAPQAEQTSTIGEAQRLLRKLGYAPGPADGIWGARTERAYRSYLRDSGLPDMGLSAQVLEGMQEAARSGASHAVGAEKPGTSQAETSEDGPAGTTETIVYDNGARYVGQTRGGEPHGRGIITWASGNRYEGAFVDGMRTGHGIYTWTSGDRYEGDFVEGKRTGRGIAAWADGNRYEGDFVAGKRTGRGVFTRPNGDRYEGDFVEGKETGRGIMTYADGERYEGEFRDGKRHGSGVLIRADGSREEVEFRHGELHGSVLTWADGRHYEGETLHGEAHGRGVMTWPDGSRYEGGFLDGVPSGQGFLLINYDNGNRYEGEVRDRIRHGRGVLAWANGDRYEGDFVEGKLTGRGVFTWADGGRYVGDFVAGKRTGRGVYTWPNGDRYQGDFRDGRLHGRGTLIWANGDRYEGDFREGKRTGRGVLTWPNGDRYQGDVRDGGQHGNGTFTWANGDRYEGEFRDGKQHGPGISIKADGRRFAVNFRDGKQIESKPSSTGKAASRGKDAPRGMEVTTANADALCGWRQRAYDGPYDFGPGGDFGPTAVSRLGCAEAVLDRVWYSASGSVRGDIIFINRCTDISVENPMFIAWCVVKSDNPHHRGNSYIHRIAKCGSTSDPFPKDAVKFSDLIGGVAAPGSRYGSGTHVLTGSAGAELLYWAWSCPK